ncbi:hypothetical protein [Pollutibacter soli]|uniref:hypothetical protein n=1 Tax=Pollutibacter soli TaxID=3034157 RepID=UPI00301371E2
MAVALRDHSLLFCGDGQLKTMELKPVAYLHTTESDSIAVKKIVEVFLLHSMKKIRRHSAEY